MPAPHTTNNASYASSGTNTATSTFNGTGVDCRAVFSARFSGTITNGGTGPTLPAIVNLQWSADNTTFTTIQSATMPTTLSVTTSYSFKENWPAGWLRIQITGNTGQSVTYSAIANGLIDGVTY